MAIEAQVVMLPRIDKELALQVVQAYKEQESSLKAHNLVTPSFVTSVNGLIKSITGELANVSGYPYNIREWVAQHLYLTTEEEIKEGDWVFNDEILRQQKIPAQKLPAIRVFKNPYLEGDRKIIASTDPSLELPAIPQSFLQALVEAQGKIDKVWLETEKIGSPIGLMATQLKLTPNNEVIIANRKAEDILGASSGAFISNHLRSLLEDKDREIEDAYEKLPKSALTEEPFEMFKAGYKTAEEKMANEFKAK